MYEYDEDTSTFSTIFQTPVHVVIAFIRHELPSGLEGKEHESFSGLLTQQKGERAISKGVS